VSRTRDAPGRSLRGTYWLTPWACRREPGVRKPGLRVSHYCRHINGRGRCRGWAEMYEVLDIARRAGHRRGGEGERDESGRGGGVQRAAEDGFVHGGIPHHPAPSDVSPASLELRLDQRDHIPTRPYERGDGLPDEAQADEREVHRDKITRSADLRGSQVAGVDPLEAHHAGIGAEPPGELPASDIHRVHACCPGLEEAIGKPSRAGPQIHRRPIPWVDAECGERVGELETSAAGVGVRWAADRHPRPGMHTAARLVRDDPVHGHVPGHDRRLGLFPRRRVSVGNDPLIEARRR
jgi:hypothetical protein